jgi:hypothetical protein
MQQKTLDYLRSIESHYPSWHRLAVACGAALLKHKQDFEIKRTQNPV